MFGVVLFVAFATVNGVTSGDTERPTAFARLAFIPSENATTADHRLEILPFPYGTLEIAQINSTYSQITNLFISLSAQRLAKTQNSVDYYLKIHEYGDTGKECKLVGSEWRKERKITIGPFSNPGSAISEYELDFTENELPLTGSQAIIGRSAVLFRQKNGKDPIAVACGPLGLKNDFNTAATMPTTAARYPIKTITRFVDKKVYLGYLRMEKSSENSLVKIFVNISRVNTHHPRFRYLHVYETSDFATKGCNSLTRVHKAHQQAIAKLTLTEDGAIVGNYTSNIDLEFLGPGSLVGRSLGLSRFKMVEMDKARPELCGVIGISSDFGPAGWSGVGTFSKVCVLLVNCSVAVLVFFEHVL